MKRFFALMVGAAAVVGLATTGATAGTKDQLADGTNSKPCLDKLGNQHGVFTYNGVEVAWPPNHKYRPAAITLTEDADVDSADEVTIATVGAHDQVAAGKELVGSGNTDYTTDVTPGTGSGTGSATANFLFRGERSGTEQGGRTYTFTATGTVDGVTKNGPSVITCEPVTFTASVPHDQGNN